MVTFWQGRDRLISLIVGRCYVDHESRYGIFFVLHSSDDSAEPELCVHDGTEGETIRSTYSVASIV